jgi:spoIIIJ-associated protein
MTEQNNTVVDDTPEDVDQSPTPASTVSTEDAGDTTATEASVATDEAVEAQSATSDPTDDPTDDLADDGTDDDGTDDLASEDGDGEEGADSAEAPRRRAVKVADLEREGEVAADFLETLLDIADLDGDIDVDVDGDRAAVSIVDSEEGRVPRRLVGQDGKVLDALQELTRLAVQSATGERSRLMLDVAGHRAERRSTLVEVARAVIEQVKVSGEKVALEPMTAFERKVVHDEVLAAGLVSESDGVEPKRFVVVLPS